MARIIDSAAQLAGALIVAFCVIKFGPSLREIVSQREVRAKGGPSGLELEIGGQPVSTQRAVDDQRKETEALRARLSLLAAQVDVLSTETATSTSNESQVVSSLVPGAPGSMAYTDPSADPLLPVRRVLWVDDEPENTAYEVAALKDRGVEVSQSRSTQDAIAKLAGPEGFDAVITDMQRLENGHLRRTAGLELITWIRQSGLSIPVLVYASRQSVNEYASAVLDAGGVGAAASATELFELLGMNFGPLSGFRLESEVLRRSEERRV